MCLVNKTEEDIAECSRAELTVSGQLCVFAGGGRAAWSGIVELGRFWAEVVASHKLAVCRTDPQ